MTLSGPAPSLADLQRLAEQAFEALPEPIRAACGPLALRVEDWPPEALLDEMGIEDPYELTGVYDGVALTEKSAEDLPGPPDAVILFRRPLLDEWADRGDVTLSDLVAHVLVHEIAHHFGWSDARIAEVDRWWE
ncbi:MAG: metallopeptidase family protein [Pseudomonadota bacterium]